MSAKLSSGVHPSMLMVSHKGTKKNPIKIIQNQSPKRIAAYHLIFKYFLLRVFFIFVFFIFDSLFAEEYIDLCGIWFSFYKEAPKPLKRRRQRVLFWSQNSAINATLLPCEKTITDRSLVGRRFWFFKFSMKSFFFFFFFWH